MKKLLLSLLFLAAPLAFSQTTPPEVPTLEHIMMTTTTPSSGTISLSRTYSFDTKRIQSPITKYRLNWTTDANGTVRATLPLFSGEIKMVVTDPGSPAPTDDYDITLVDNDGFDVLAGTGANRDTTTSERFTPYSSTYSLIQLMSPLSFTVDAAGANKQGAVILYVKER